MDEKLEEALKRHPCYDEDAHRKFARMHLPVAPGCNIRCNYCNRKYDCSNESRPGVTSEILSPEEAVDKVAMVKDIMPELTVVAVAGPGDPLANDETFDTIRSVHERFPELTLCISTNGLALPDNAERLHGLGVRFLTVTMNATDPAIGEKIYSTVNWKGRELKGREGAETLLRNQISGIKECVRLGMKVKVNIVMIPGINDDHIPDLVKTVRSLGAHTVNILPLIPVEGTAFSNRRAPTSEERRRLMDICEADAKMMRHCKQCRADAIGLLGEDRSQEFMRMSSCRAQCGPPTERPVPAATDAANIAVATSDGRNVDCGFGNTRRFDVYSVSGQVRFLRSVYIDTSKEVVGGLHREHTATIADLLDDCSVIVVKEIGHMPFKHLEDRGKTVKIYSGGTESILSTLNAGRSECI